jgi:glycosyltransferase involved in cell wall biosynthesis
MPEAPVHPTRVDVLHLFPADMARGAQVYGRAIVDILEATTDHHHVIATLFDSPGFALDADVRLGVPNGLLRRRGFDPRASLRLRALLRRMRPRVVLAHGAEPAKYAALAGLGGIPLVFYAIGSADRRLLRPSLRRFLYRVYSRRATLMPAVSRDVADEARELLGVAAGKLSVIPNGRDPRLYRPAESIGDGSPRLVFVGHLTRTKRPEVFIRIVETLRSEGLDIEAIMVGDGELEVPVRVSAAAAGVDVLGRRDDVPSLLAESDIFVFPSLPEHEGMPGVLIEAGLCGLATVATAVPGARDVIDDGHTGFVVPVEDSAALIDAVRRLVVDDGLRRRMGAAARDRCLERFTLEASAALWRDMLDPLLR